MPNRPTGEKLRERSAALAVMLVGSTEQGGPKLLVCFYTFAMEEVARCSMSDGSPGVGSREGAIVPSIR